jgi:hypothetical protein
MRGGGLGEDKPLYLSPRQDSPTMLRWLVLAQLRGPIHRLLIAKVRAYGQISRPTCKSFLREHENAIQSTSRTK